MSVDIIAEIAAGMGITLTELARQHRTAPSTVFRWVQRGLPRGDGTRVRLEAIRRGKRWLTTPTAISRFFAQLPTNVPAPTAAPVRTPANRQKDNDVAKKVLHERYGI